MNRLILQVFYVIFSGLAQALSIANEISIFGSPILALFCLFPMYIALFKSKSYKETLFLVFTQVITVHLISSFWLANFHGFGIFTLGASAIGTGLQGLVCSVIMHLYPSTITENQKLIENAGNNHFNIFKRILWFSICWTLFEYEKSIGVLGYPWGTIYMGAYKNQAIIQIAEITGVWGISFIHILISSCIAELFLYLENKSHIQNTKTVKKNLKQIFVFSISIYLLTAIFGLSRLMIKENPIKYLNTIIVQQNADPWGQDESTSLKSSMILTENALEKIKKDGYKADIVLWSEGILGHPFPKMRHRYNNNPENESLINFIKRMETPFIIGGITKKDDYKRNEFQNSAILFDKNGSYAGFYSKMQLVPFAEYIPFFDNYIMNYFMTNIIGMYSTMTPGYQYVIFKVPLKAQAHQNTPLDYMQENYAYINLDKNGKIKQKDAEKYLKNSLDNPLSFVQFSTPICFEDAFPRTCRILYNLGSEVFLNITNDSWSEKKSAEYQHFVVASYRAIEFRTTLVRCTNSGYSAVVNPYGDIVFDMPLFEECADYVRVPIYKHKQTIYAQYGDWFIYILLCVIAIYIIYFFLKARQVKLNIPNFNFNIKLEIERKDSKELLSYKENLYNSLENNEKLQDENLKLKKELSKISKKLEKVSIQNGESKTKKNIKTETKITNKKNGKK